MNLPIDAAAFQSIVGDVVLRDEAGGKPLQERVAVRARARVREYADARAPLLQDRPVQGARLRQPRERLDRPLRPVAWPTREHLHPEVAPDCICGRWRRRRRFQRPPKLHLSCT